MHRILLFAFFVAFGGTILPAQTASPTSDIPPQTARQALIEMFLGKGPNDFAKHLPDDARQTLIRKGDTPEASWALRISEIGRQLTAQGHVETFDDGPTILATEMPNSHEKVEISVEHDSLMGDADEIELAVHYYKDGQPVSLPVLPVLTFTFQQEKEIWRLSEVTLAAHVPLTNPDYLKGLRKQQDEANEAAAQTRIISIVYQENGYIAQNPERGYNCMLIGSSVQYSPLGTSGSVNLSNQGQASEESNGYRFTMSGCERSPSSKYRITAEPIDPDSEMKTFCADQSGTVKFVKSGKASTCFSQGETLNSVQLAPTLE